MKDMVAESRRRDTAERVGFSIDELIRWLNDVKGIPVSSKNRMAISRLFLPPNAQHTNAKRFFGVFDNVKVKTTLSSPEDNAAQHHNRAQVRVCAEMAADCADEVRLFSVDPKAQIPLGFEAAHHLAGNRRHHRKVATLPSHVFSSPNRVTPDGILELDLKSSKDVVDLLGRKHKTFVRSGQMNFKLRATQYHETNPATHANDLTELLDASPSEHSVLMTITDNGDAGGPSNWQSLLNNGRIWKSRKADAFVQVSPSAADSSTNPIERTFSHTTQDIAGKVFGSAKSLPAEEKKVRRQK
jgi:hypothetical protein